VHTDLVGPTTTKGLKGERYFMLLVDDYTRMTAVCFLKNKLEAFENFKIYKEMVENEMDSRIKCLRIHLKWIMEENSPQRNLSTTTAIME
jgi:hypothetical protein